jgi:hypothetical protein
MADQYRPRHIYVHKFYAVDLDPSALRRLRNLKSLPRYQIMLTFWTSMCGVYLDRFNHSISSVEHGYQVRSPWAILH